MRVFRNQEQWQVIIEKQQASGLTIIDYCREHQLSTSSFYAVRKNWLFSNTSRGANASAILYSFVETDNQLSLSSAQ